MALVLLLAAFLVIAPWWGRGVLAFVRDLDELRAARNLRDRRRAREGRGRKSRPFLSLLRDRPRTCDERDYEDRVFRLVGLAFQAAGLAVTVVALIVAAA
jgi:hypothetical protein